MRIADLKDIKGVTTFKNMQEAQKARERALISEAKWKRTSMISIASLVICWILLLIGMLAEVAILVSVIISFGVYIYCEMTYGKMKWLNIFPSFLSGSSGLFILIWLIEILIFFGTVMCLAELAAGFGLGIILLNGDRHYYLMTIEATDGYGFDDSRAQMAASEIEQKTQDDSEKWGEMAQNAAAMAKEAARTGVDAVSKKISDSSNTAGSHVASAGSSGYEQKSRSFSTQAQISGKTWYCPQCGKENNGKFCSSCGTQKPI